MLSLPLKLKLSFKKPILACNPWRKLLLPDVETWPSCWSRTVLLAFKGLDINSCAMWPCWMCVRAVQVGGVPDECLHEVVFIRQLAGTGTHLFEVYCKPHKSELVEWIKHGSFLPLLAQGYEPRFYVSVQNPWEPKVGGYCCLTAWDVIWHFPLHLISSLALLHTSDPSCPILIHFSGMLFLWKKSNLCYWYFIISFSFHIIKRNLMFLFNFIWSCINVL